MALYRITIKRSANVNGVRLEKGMSIELASTSSNPLGSSQCKAQIAELFKTKYGVDVAKACAIGQNMMSVDKI